MKMIKKSLVSAFWIGTVYLLIIAFFGSKRVPSLQGIRQDNLVRAQTVLWGAHHPENIIVGSSLPAMMDTRILGSNFHSLAISGYSSITGLELLERNLTFKPKRILVEAQFLNRNSTKDIQESIERPFMSFFRKHIKGFRDQFRPATVIANKISKVFGKLESWANSGPRQPRIPLKNSVSPDLERTNTLSIVALPNPNPKPAPKLKLPAQISPEDVKYPHLVEYSMHEFVGLIETNQVLDNLKLLKNLVNRFEKKGVECIFFETPVHLAITNTPLSIFQHQLFSKAFPTSRYRWILPEPGVHYFTADGIHLTGDSIKLYTDYFTNAVEIGASENLRETKNEKP